LASQVSNIKKLDTQESRFTDLFLRQAKTNAPNGAFSFEVKLGLPGNVQKNNAQALFLVESDRMNGLNNETPFQAFQAFQACH